MTQHDASMAAEYAHGALKAQRERATWMQLARDARKAGMEAFTQSHVRIARMSSREVRAYLGFIRRMANG